MSNNKSQEDDDSNPGDQLHIIVLPEEWRPGVDQQYSELCSLKEEQVCISLKEEQPTVTATDATLCLFTAGFLKSENDEKKPLFPCLNQHQMEGSYLPKLSSADQMKEEEGAESTRKPNVNIQECVLISSDTEDSEVDDSWRGHIPDFGLKPKDDVSKWSESRAPKSGEHAAHQCHPSVNNRLQNTSSGDVKKCHKGKKYRINVRKELLKPLSCDSCGKRFTLKKALRKHKTGHDGETSFVCWFCDATLSTKTLLKKHLRTHTREKVFPCGFCKKKLCSEKSFWKHTQTHTQNICDICGEHYATEHGLKAHKRVHEELLVCFICGESFRYKTSLKKHLTDHTDYHPFVCDICQQGFKCKLALNVHIRDHTGGERFVCDFCGKRNSSKMMFEAHRRSHTEEKPFSCDFCEERFMMEASLKSHLQCHFRKRQTCDVCGKKFTNKRKLNKHMISHTGKGCFVCNFCQKAFDSQIALRSHLRCHANKGQVIGSDPEIPVRPDTEKESFEC